MDVRERKYYGALDFVSWNQKLKRITILLVSGILVNRRSKMVLPIVPGIDCIGFTYLELIVSGEQEVFRLNFGWVSELRPMSRASCKGVENSTAILGSAQMLLSWNGHG